VNATSCPELLIRDERADDADAITALTLAAFETLAISRHTEHLIVVALRAAGALAVSRVAESGGELLGHVAASPVTLSDGTTGWYGLGPVSVLPRCQRLGIGQMLVRNALAQLRASGAAGCCLVGHPGYYRRFGFDNVAGLGLPGVPPEVFFALSFCGRVPQGSVAFHDAFAAGA
jgi:putative acetyltransferase